MAPAPGRLSGAVKMPVQVRMLPEEMAAVDAFAAELSQQSYGAAFSRAEALRIAAMEWLKARQARRASVPTSHPQSEPERAVAEEAPVVTTPAPPLDRDAIVARARQLREAELSYQKIAAQLNAEGVPTISGIGRWHPGSVGALLTEDRR